MRRFWTRRARVVLITVGALLILDLGRSLFARFGYARPTEVWQPAPAVYADLTWPPGSSLPADASVGQRIYAQRCAVCHGPDGRGNGPAAPSMIPRPRDFTVGQFKYKSTPAGQPPSDEDLIRVVRDGLPASAMPYWGDLLTGAEIEAAVEHIKSLSAVFEGAAPLPITVPTRTGRDPAGSIERGRQLYTALGCAGCHGPDGRGGGTLKDAKGYPVLARDLTAPWTFRGGSEAEQIWLRLTTGLAPGPMPSFADRTTPEERWDLVSYVRSLARTPPWEPGGKLEGPGQQADLLRRGEYLVHAEMCGLCHTQINRTGIYRGDDAYLAGGMRVGAYPHGVFVSRNLTSDPETGLGNWTEEEIANAIRNGRARGRLLNPYGMAWPILHSFEEEDALAVARYLKTLPAVRNQIPPPLHYGVVETLVAKLTRPLPAVPTNVLTYADGNFAEDGGLPRDLTQRLLIGGQWLALLGGAAAFVLVTPRERRWRPRGTRGWVLAAASLVGVSLIGAVGSARYNLPTLRVIPPDQIAQGFQEGLPQPDPAILQTPEQTALTQRGRYLFAVTSCAMCHGDGSGGLKVSWQPFGTLWVRNITPDSATGIGEWSDAEIARAIRSGVSRDGRALHWQGMIWDHLSNLDEEDVRALVSYLRVIPPIRREIPTARAPAADDCTIYTFWTSESAVPGCG